MQRPLLFDLTHMVSRLAISSPTGIDRVDLMFASHFVGQVSSKATAIHYGIAHPHLIEPERARSIVRMGEELWGGRLRNRNCSFQPLSKNPDDFERNKLRPRFETLDWIRRQVLLQVFRTRHSAKIKIEPDSTYINVAQHLLEYPIFFKWFSSRQDVFKVFFLHDLLPLDYPEYFPSGYRERFDRRLRTIVEYANALIVSTHNVARRVDREFRDRGRYDVSIFVAPLPSPLEFASISKSAQMGLPPAPYFVVVGTVEPRKNHLLLLHIWRELVEGPGPVPTLVIVGGRGWESEQVIDLLSRCSQIRPHIYWVNGLSIDSLRSLLAGARGLLAPSFAEGYGLPLVEALSFGTPVVAADIPVFREVSQNRALFLRPLDGSGWQKAIEELSATDSAIRANLIADANEFCPPQSDSYFELVEKFLSTL